MDSEFPNSDEEYELLNYDDPPKTAPSQHTGGTRIDQSVPTNNSKIIEKKPKGPTNIQPINMDDFPDLDEELELISASTQKPIDEPLEKARKRTFDELCRDVKAILNDDLDFTPDEEIHRQDKRLRWNDPPHLIIEAMKNQRKKALEQKEFDSTSALTHILANKKSNSITTRVPSWNFVAVTRSTDSQRLYVRFRPEKPPETPKLKPLSGLLSNFNQLRDEADEILLQKAKRASLAPTPDNRKVDDDLWVEKYRPKRFVDLLSDDQANMKLLYWLKSWEKLVFNRESVKRAKPKVQAPWKKFNRANEDEILTDHKGFPRYRVALIGGPPGLGKTTLVNVATRNFGYNAVEINASDDRGPEAFREALLASTQMKSMIGTDPRPNCLVLDEIDGASAAAIDLLIKFIQGKLLPKGKKASGKKVAPCKRPIICICNEIYTASLRPLRTIAYNINVSSVDGPRLLHRLMLIAEKENINVSHRALSQLAQNSGHDIRTCLGALQFMGKDCEKMSGSIETKDTKQGLFGMWREIFEIPTKDFRGPLSIRERAQKILHLAHSDSSERIVQGVFENYPANCLDSMDKIADSMEWFEFYDEISTAVMTTNDWRVMPYTNYAFVSWHLGFAKTKKSTLTFPYTATEVHQKLQKIKGILTAAQHSCSRDIQTVILDISPYLFEILNPRLRSVAVNLYTIKEKNDLERLIDVMLSLGLTIVQEKREDGPMDYQLEPNLFEVGVFPGCKPRKGLPYATKQVIAHQLEIQRAKRSAAVSGPPIEHVEKIVPKEVPVTPEPVPVPPVERKFKDFFANFKRPPPPQQQVDTHIPPTTTSPKTENRNKRMREIISKYGVWFKFNEGFSNAIRRTVRVKDVL